MSLPNYKYWDIRIDDAKYGIRIDSDLPIRIDHAAISGVIANPPERVNVTTTNNLQSEITTTSDLASRLTQVTN